jgi:hypothetical protein
MFPGGSLSSPNIHWHRDVMCDVMSGTWSGFWNLVWPGNVWKCLNIDVSMCQCPCLPHLTNTCWSKTILFIRGSEMSSNSVNPIPCSLCGEGGHRPRCCPELRPDADAGLDGFWKGQRMADDACRMASLVLSYRQNYEEEDCCRMTSKINSRKKAYVRLYVFGPRKVKHQTYNKLIRNKTK